MAPFAFPALPSLPSVKSLINVSPPLVYPSAEDTKWGKARSRASSMVNDKYTSQGSSSTSKDRYAQYQDPSSSNVWRSGDKYGYRRGSSSSRRGRYEEDTDNTPTKPPFHHSNSLMASPHLDADDTIWEPLPARKLLLDQRRRSVGSSSDCTPHASPSTGRGRALGGRGGSRGGRPSHHRSQSALPSRTPQRSYHSHSLLSSPSSGPAGRLFEISRTGMGSASAVSLPTLNETIDNPVNGRRDVDNEEAISITSASDDSSSIHSVARRMESPDELSPSSYSSSSHMTGMTSITSLSEATSPILRAKPRQGSRSSRERDGADPPSPISPSFATLPATAAISESELMPPPPLPTQPVMDQIKKEGHKRSFSSVPPPQTKPLHPVPRPFTHSIMRGQTLGDGTLAGHSGNSTGRIRRSSESFIGCHAKGSTSQPQAASYSQAGSRRPFPVHRHSSATSTASVSDVAVLATWSFPESPPKAQSAHSTDSPNALGLTAGTEHQVGFSQPSGRLRQRLRSLSVLDTGSPQQATGSPAEHFRSHRWSFTPTAQVTNSPSLTKTPPVSVKTLPYPAPASAPSPKPSLKRASTTVRTLAPPSLAHRPHLTHRHSHSSPSNLLPPLPIGPSISGASHSTTTQRGSPTLNPLLPLPLPSNLPRRNNSGRRPTTTKLRQPNPLSMPIEITPSSSPGSMISDLSTIPDDRSINSILEGDKRNSSDCERVSLNSLDIPHSNHARENGGPGFIINVSSEDMGSVESGSLDSLKLSAPPDLKLRTRASSASLKRGYKSQGGMVMRGSRSTLSLHGLLSPARSPRRANSAEITRSEVDDGEIGEGVGGKWSSFVNGLGLLGMRSRRGSLVQPPKSPAKSLTSLYPYSASDGLAEEEEEEEEESYISLKDVF